MAAARVRRSLLTAAGVAAGLALTACGPGDSGSSDSSAPTHSAPTHSAAAQHSSAPTTAPSAAPTGSAAPTTAPTAPQGAGKDRDCGSAPSGLAVIVPGSNTATSCSTALAVAGAYGKAMAGGSTPPVTVTVGGAAWQCQEKKGNINPYQECTDTADSAQTIRISS